MCTFNISIDDELAAQAKANFDGEQALVDWMRTSIQALLRERLSQRQVEDLTAKRQAIDNLMGVLGPDTGSDYRKMYYEEKYGK